MKTSALLIALFFVLTGCSNNIKKPNNFNELFKLRFEQHTCSGTDPAPSHSKYSNNGSLFFATITTNLSCGLVAQNPEIFANSKGITLAVNTVSPSGFTAACFCSRTLDFSFTLPPDFTEYKFELISFTINNAVVDVIPINEEFSVKKQQ